MHFTMCHHTVLIHLNLSLQIFVHEIPQEAQCDDELPLFNAAR